MISFSKSHKKKSKYQSLGVEDDWEHNVNSRESYKNGGNQFYSLIL